MGFRGISRDMSRISQGYFKCISKTFQGYRRMFRDCFKDVSQYSREISKIYISGVFQGGVRLHRPYKALQSLMSPYKAT